MRPDTGSYNRLLTSLGLVCVAAALLIPYFYFKNTSVLLTSRTELRDLTPTARDSLINRQAAISSLEPWVIALSVFLVVFGVVLVVVGARRLRDAQISEDEETDLRKKRALAEYRDMTPDEQAKKRSKLAQSERSEEQREAGENERDRAAQDAGSSTDSSVERQSKSPGFRSAINAEAVSRVQMRFEKVFSDTRMNGVTFAPSLMVRSGVGRIETDGIFSFEDQDQPEVLLELKLSSNPSVLVKSARNRATEALAHASRFGSIAVEHAAVWLVIVVIRDEESTASRTKLDEVEKRLNEYMLNRGAASVVCEEEMETLPSRFEELLRGGRFDAPFV